MRSKTWYAVSVIMYVKRASTRQRIFPVFENVFLVSATSPGEALRRGQVIGRREASAGELSWNGRAARLVFGGVRKVVACAPNPARRGSSFVRSLHEGVEATYSQFAVAGEANLRLLIRGGRTRLTYEP